MRLQRVSVLAPFADPNVDPEHFVPTFHRWIRDGAVGGLPIDVARYNHVPGGPGTVLIGFTGDYAIDTSTGVPALRYTLKRENQGSIAELLSLAVGRLQQAAEQITAETGHAVDQRTITVRIADKLVAPNTDEGRQLVERDVVAAVSAAAGFDGPTVRFATLDPRDPITIVVGAAAA